MTATSVNRTIADCSSLLRPRALQNVLDSALDRRLTTVPALISALDRRRAPQHRAGNATLLTLIEPWAGAVTPESPAEARLFRQLVAWGFPVPELQIPVTDHHGRVIARLDAGWSDRRIGLEYDSSRWHNPAAWKSDESRHARITSLGWELLHVDRLDLLPGNASSVTACGPRGIAPRPPFEHSSLRST